MENYFWIAGQCHLTEQNQFDSLISVTHSKEYIDVLGLVGPNRLPVAHTEIDYEPCLADAILARAFELHLEMERKRDGFRKHTRWSALAQSLVHSAPEPSRFRQCPISYSTPPSESRRIVIDAFHVYPRSLSILAWALADIENPSTAFGRACGSRRYLLLGGEETETSNLFPTDPFTEILELLGRLGCDNIAQRLTSAAPLVWDLVECAVHTGLAAGMKLEIDDSTCECDFCKTSRVADSADISAHLWLGELDSVSDGIPPINRVRIKGIACLFKLEPIRRKAKGLLIDRVDKSTSYATTSPTTAAAVLNLAASQTLSSKGVSPSFRCKDNPDSLQLASLLSKATNIVSTIPQDWRLTIFRFVDVADAQELSQAHLFEMLSGKRFSSAECWSRLTYLRANQPARLHAKPKDNSTVRLECSIKPCATSLVNVYDSVDEVWRPCQSSCKDSVIDCEVEYLQTGVAPSSYFDGQISNLLDDI